MKGQSPLSHCKKRTRRPSARGSNSCAWSARRTATARPDAPPRGRVGVPVAVPARPRRGRPGGLRPGRAAGGVRARPTGGAGRIPTTSKNTAATTARFSTNTFHASRINALAFGAKASPLPPSGARAAARSAGRRLRGALASRSTRIALTSRTLSCVVRSLGFSTSGKTRTRPVSRGTTPRGRGHTRRVERSALTFKRESTDAFARIDATLRAADEAFNRAADAVRDRRSGHRRRLARRRRERASAPRRVLARARTRTSATRATPGTRRYTAWRARRSGGPAPRTRAAADAARVLLRRGADQRPRTRPVTPHQAVRVGDVGLVGTLLRFAEEAEMRGMFGPSQTIWPNVPTDADADETSRREDKAEEKTSTQTLPTLPTRRKKKGTAYELVNRASRSGATPLHSAAELGHFEIFEALLAYGAEFDARTIRGESVAHVGARLGRVAILEKLLECRETLFAPSDGASPIGTRDDGLDSDFLVARDHTESFPIHWAAAGGHAACIAALIRAGSPVSIEHVAAPPRTCRPRRRRRALACSSRRAGRGGTSGPGHASAYAAGWFACDARAHGGHARLDAADAAGVLENAARRDARKPSRAFGSSPVGVRLSGGKRSTCFTVARAGARRAVGARAGRQGDVAARVRALRGERRRTPWRRTKA